MHLRCSSNEFPLSVSPISLDHLLNTYSFFFSLERYDYTDNYHTSFFNAKIILHPLIFATRSSHLYGRQCCAQRQADPHSLRGRGGVRALLQSRPLLAALRVRHGPRLVHTLCPEVVRTLRLGPPQHHPVQRSRQGCQCALWSVISTKMPFFLRPPLKIILFPVHRPGDPICAEWIHFFRF